MKMKETAKAARKIAESFCVTNGHQFRLKDADPGDTLDFTSEDKPSAKKALAMGVQALAGLQRWCGFYDALTGTVQRQLVQLRALADTASAARRLLSAELQRRALGTGEEPAPTA